MNQGCSSTSTPQNDTLSASHKSTAGEQILANGEVVAANLFDPSPENEAATLRNIDKLKGIGTRSIQADSGKSKPLERSAKSLGEVRFTVKRKDHDLDSYFAEYPIARMLVLKDGSVAYERYGLGNTEETRWTSMSIAKSVTSTLIGAAIKDGLILTVQDPVTKYLPELRDTVYKENTLQHLLQMSSGVKWDESTYTVSGDSEISRYFAPFNSGRSNAMMDLMKSIVRIAAPGVRGNYNTGDYFLLAKILSRVTHKTTSDYLSEKIWKPAGMERDGFWLLDAPDGQELGGTSATLRDFGRLGQFILDEAPRIVPDGWFNEATAPAFALDDDLYYGYGWKTGRSSDYSSPHAILPFGHGGLYGQKLHIDPTRKMVIVQWGAFPPVAPDNDSTTPWNAIREAITQKIGW
ncbi:serine hydrolase (plasmid) [Rhizobium sp. CB3090]|uniref:serine hydrolase domain-containing protein n=1 Tax=Rhizobium sp. CB3090 TaxID=3039156 RepID=UPI0024B0ABDE|nr:serine hydrolase [Rhizobium sp. CB3090]WFU12802.1 serine hydrolase [Rhizobium sp. CB3090]